MHHQLVLEVAIRVAELNRAFDALPPITPRDTDVIESPIRRASRQRHYMLQRGLRMLGYRYDAVGEVWAHVTGAVFHLEQFMVAWRWRSTSAILACAAFVRRRPALAQELWMPVVLV